MNCPKCMMRMRVKDSRTPDSITESTAGLRKTIAHAVSWFTADWVARFRTCVNDECRHTMMTVEMSVGDLAAGWIRRKF